MLAYKVYKATVALKVTRVIAAYRAYKDHKV
jgi:hypothetical protein